MKTSEALELLFPFVDSLYESYHIRAAQKRAEFAESETSITCAKGCGACCHFPIIPATAGEAFVLLHQLIARGENFAELAQKFLTYAQSYFEFVRASGTLPFTQKSQSEFFQMKLPCPLFVKTQSSAWSGHCGVFEFRPLICDYFHSTQSPALCEKKLPHGTFQSLIDLGEEAVESIRMYERTHFGRSALGHLPLLLAALCTEEGLSQFLSVKSPLEDFDPEVQAERDFEFYIELLASIGYDVTARDLHALIEAQEESLGG